MAQYQVYNGTDWVNICECLLNIKDSQGNWVEIDNCPVRYWTGTEWCLIDCIPLGCNSIIDSFFAKIQNEEITDEDRFTALEFILVNGIDGSNVNNCCPSCDGEVLQNIYYFGSTDTFLKVAEAIGGLDVCCLDSVSLT